MGQLYGYEAYELIGSGTFTFSESEVTAQRIYKVRTADALSIVATLYDTTVRIGPFLFPNVPETHPKFPGKLWVRTVKVGPLSGSSRAAFDDDGFITYTWSKLTVGYKTLAVENEDEDGVLFSESIGFAGEFMNVPKGTFKVPNGQGVRVGEETEHNEEVAIWIAQADLQLSFPELSGAINNEYLFNNQGKVNDSAFRGVGAEKLLWAGSNTNREVSSDGTVKKSLDLQFIVRQQSWNDIYTKSGWQAATPKPHTEMDMSAIFSNLIQ